MNNTLENNINSVADDGEEHTWRNRSLGSITMNKNLSTEICQSRAFFILLIIIAIIPALQLFVGWRYSTACPINQLISHYLIIAGIVGLVLVSLIAITQIMTRTFAKTTLDDTINKTNVNRTTMLVGCGMCSVMCVNLSLFVFLLGWAVVGWIWVIEVWHRVQYRRTGRDDYCHPILYQFTFSLLLLTTTFKLVFFCFVCRKTCKRVYNRQRRDTFTSEEG